MIIGPQSNTACITIEAVDDEIAEGAEFFNLVAIANNIHDIVNGTASIEIADNDGMYNNNNDRYNMFDVLTHKLNYTGVTISHFSNAVSINEGDNSTAVSLRLSMIAEREVPVILKISLGSTFSSIYICSNFTCHV